MTIWSKDDSNPPVYPVAEFGVVVFRTVDRWQHGVMLAAHLTTDEVVHLTFTAEQARLLKEELEKVLPFASRRDA